MSWLLLQKAALCVVLCMLGRSCGQAPPPLSVVPVMAPTYGGGQTHAQLTHNSAKYWESMQDVEEILSLIDIPEELRDTEIPQVHMYMKCSSFQLIKIGKYVGYGWPRMYPTINLTHKTYSHNYLCSICDIHVSGENCPQFNETKVGSHNWGAICPFLNIRR